MSKQIFINLPVHDLAKAKAFYTALGHSINPKFSDDNAACVVISDTIYVMLLVNPFFQGFTPKAICDTATHIETLLALSAESRAEVDAVMEKALAAGGKEPTPARDHGFMFQRTFEDLDGHTWELFYMDESVFPGA